MVASSERGPIFGKQVTGAAADHSLAEVTLLVPKMSGVGDKEQLSSPEEQTKFESWELALLTRYTGQAR